MPEISLYGKNGAGKVALCDEQDYPLLSQHRWHLSRHGYPRTYHRNAAGRSSTVDMHRLLTDDKGGHFKDHKNGDPLDNRRANLRPCTQQENARNRRRHANNKTGFKGVSPFGSRFRAVIHLEGKKQIYLGTYPHAVLAAIAYNAAATALFGPFAKLNELPPFEVRLEVADAAD